jgi:hypothetical protein
MKTPYKTLTVAFAALVIPLLFVSNSTAQCGIKLPAVTHASWRYQLGQPRFLPAAFIRSNEDDHDDAAIVGFWHFKFVAKGEWCRTTRWHRNRRWIRSMA